MRNAERTDPKPKAPWWQTTRTRRRGFVLAAVFLILGGLLVAYADGNQDSQMLRLSAGALFLLVGAAHLLSAIAMGRLRRIGPDAVADPRRLPTAS